MAQDRLWQMDYLRRAGEGSLAEIFGSGYLEADHLMRAVRAGRKTVQPVDRLEGPTKVWIERFVQGINRYIVGHAKKLPVEFSLLEYRPDPFSVEDVLSICYALAWHSSRAASVDPLMARILGRLGTERGSGLAPSDPAVFPGLAVADLVGWEPLGILFATLSERRPPGFPALTGGSLWGVTAGKSRSGKPLLSAMYHQRLMAPGFWYQARLVASDFHLSGVFVPGVPVAFAGTNSYTSWACVPAPVDDADLYIEHVDTEPPSRVWKVDRWRKVTQLREGYRLRGGSTETRTCWLTDTGPLVSDVHRGRAFSLKWIGTDGLGLIPMLYALNRTRGGEEIKQALRLLCAPGMNVLWGDVEGNFGMQLGGKIPIRHPESDGIVPMPAWTGVHDWKGFIPFNELPSVTNPPAGMVVFADGRPGGLSYPYLVSCYWGDELLTHSIRNLLDRGAPHYRETFQTIQGDTRSPLAAELTPLIVQAAKAQGSLSREEQTAVSLLESWDYSMERDSAAAAIFALCYQSLVNDLLSNTLGERLFNEYSRDFSLVAKLVRKIFVQRQKTWPAPENPQKMLTDAFHRGVARGHSLIGSEPFKWRWSDLHVLVFRHPLAGRSRFLEGLYHVGPIAMGGSGDTIMYSGWSPAHPYEVSSGISFRYIADLTSPPLVYSGAALGSSGHFFSSNYKNQTRAWAEGKISLEPIDAADMRKAGGSPVLFRPTRASSISQRQGENQE